MALFTCSIQIIGFLAITTKENISFESELFAFAVGLYSYAPFGIKTTLQLLEIATSHVSFYSSLSKNFWNFCLHLSLAKIICHHQILQKWIGSELTYICASIKNVFHAKSENENENQHKNVDSWKSFKSVPLSLGFGENWKMPFVRNRIWLKLGICKNANIWMKYTKWG